VNQYYYLMHVKKVKIKLFMKIFNWNWTMESDISDIKFKINSIWWK